MDQGRPDVRPAVPLIGATKMAMPGPPDAAGHRPDAGAPSQRVPAPHRLVPRTRAGGRAPDHRRGKANLDTTGSGK
ncbi:MAG: hypothetical protein ACK58T_36230, partial [Phycisphaerae bacterium]